MRIGNAPQGKDIEDAIKELCSTSDYSMFKEGLKFCVRGEKIEWDAYPTQEIERMCGDLIVGKTGAKVNLSDPDLLVRVVLTPTQMYLCVDTSKEDLSKRDYKIFAGSDPYKGTTGAAFAMFSGFDAKKSTVDVMCGAGILSVESALIVSGRSAHYFNKEKFLFTRWQIPSLADPFDKWDEDILDRKIAFRVLDSNNRSVEAAKKNAKIAGVIRQLSFARMDAEWLDIKFEESSVDLCMSMVYVPLRTPQEHAKWFEEFFYQVEFILKKGGAACLLCKQPEAAKEAASKRKFKLWKETQLFQNKDCWHALAWKCAK